MAKGSCHQNTRSYYIYIYTHTDAHFNGKIGKDLKLAVQAVKNRSTQIDQSKKKLKFMSDRIDSN